jgi:prepilin-type N-terminal cleavage/methylation domain-containing protein
MTIDYHRCPTRQRGFTLIEATLAMVLLGMAAAGVLLPFVGGASVQADGQHRTLAAILANDQIERIVATPFDDVVSQYNYTEAKGQVKDASGTVFSDPMYANFSRRTSCQEVYVPQESGAMAAGFILATVQIWYQDQEMTTIRRLISKP